MPLTGQVIVARTAEMYQWKESLQTPQGGHTELPRTILQKAVLDAFAPELLKILLKESTPSRDFADLVPSNAAFDTQVVELIDRADNEGWLGDLIDAMLRARNGNAHFVAAVRPIADKLKAEGSSSMGPKVSLDGSSPVSKGTEDWYDIPIVEDKNPEMRFRSNCFWAVDAKLNGWRLDTLDCHKFRISLSEALTPDAPRGWTRDGNDYYNGDPQNPRVGDMRVRYLGLPSGTPISVLARQNGDDFAIYKATNGYELPVVAEIGDHSASELIESRRKDVATYTWLKRGGAAFLLVIGLALAWAFSGFRKST